MSAVHAFFTRLYGEQVVTGEDADDDLLLLHLGDRPKTVAVAADFLELDVTEIPEKLAAWNIAHLSRTLERGCRLKITGDGPEEERNDRR